MVTVQDSPELTNQMKKHKMRDFASQLDSPKLLGQNSTKKVQVCEHRVSQERLLA